MHTVMHHAIPGLSLFVGKRGITKCTPLLEQRCAAILPAKIGNERLFEAAAKGHGRPSLFLTPPIEIAKTIAARAAQIAGELGVAIAHLGHPAECSHCWRCRRAPP